MITVFPIVCGEGVWTIFPEMVHDQNLWMQNLFMGRMYGGGGANPWLKIIAEIVSVVTVFVDYQSLNSYFHKIGPAKF